MMLDFHQKRKVKSVMYHRVTLIILAILVLFLVHSTWAVFQKKRESEALRNIADKNVSELEAREQDLISKIERLDTAPGVEEEIRAKFSVVKESENMVVVLDDNSKTATTSKSSGFWHRIKFFFKYE